MFKRIFCKNNLGRGVKNMYKNLLVAAFIFVLVLGVASLGLAQVENVRIAANVGEVHQMNLTLNKVVGTTWTIISDRTGIGMDFGSLTKGGDDIFRSDAYFILDAPVTSNKTSWTITHTRTDFAKDATNNLNANTNVKLVKVDNTTSAETTLVGGYVSYQNSNNKIVNSSDLTGARLRIYYSLAGGTGDASGVSTITPAKPSGNYTGTVTLTLSP